MRFTIRQGHTKSFVINITEVNTFESNHQQNPANAGKVFAGVPQKETYYLFIFTKTGDMIISKLSEGVQVSVETYFQPDYSNPTNNEYMFAYRINIENHNSFSVQLHRRHWHIFDSNGEYREVEGEGVVGQQPVLKPGEEFQYVSGCNLRTEMGKMYGKYTMENQNNKQTFEVNIPAFEMIVPFKMN